MTLLGIIGGTVAKTIQSIPMPYTPRMDDVVTMVLLCCFLVSAYILSRSRKFLYQLVKDFLLNRERTSIFTTSTATDMRYLLLLIVQTCVLAALCLFDYFIETEPALVEHISPTALFGIYIGICLGYLFIKWVLYSFLGWIFFDTSRVSLWMESYSTLLYYLGFALFPLALAMVFLNLEMQTNVIIALILALFTKILIFYKWLKLFCSKIYGCMLLILYFCALEIVPCLILYRGMIQLNEFLIIKF